MPELPDLEVFKGNVYERLSSKKLVGVNVYHHQKVKATWGVLSEELKGRELVGVERFGKELLFDFGGGKVVAVHLMLSGRISILDKVNGGSDALGQIGFKVNGGSDALGQIGFKVNGGSDASGQIGFKVNGGSDASGQIGFKVNGGSDASNQIGFKVNGESDALGQIKFKVFSMDFENEVIVFSDIGGLCTVRYKPVFGDAPDAFGEDFTLEYFLSVGKKRARTNVKAFLIDQKVVKGIGNAYVDEILWEVRISPHSKVGKIPEEVQVELYRGIGKVLKEAVASIKKVAPDIISGEERSFLKVHTKKRKVTETGFPIVVERIASKITYYTEEQVLYL